MRRKVSQQGPATLMVSLPSKWVKENNVIKGQEVEIKLGKNSLHIYTEGKKPKEEKNIVLDISGMNKFFLSRYLTVLYRNNYDRITLKYNNEEMYDIKNQKKINMRKALQKMTERFIGAEIISHTDKKCEIQCFVSYEKHDLSNVQRRIYYLIKENINELLDSIDKNFDKYYGVSYEYHDNITKFINYYTRQLINSNDDENVRLHVFSLMNVIDRAVDYLRYVAERINENGCPPKVKKYLKEIFDIFLEIFYAFNNDKLSNEVIIKRYNLVQRLKKEKFSAQGFFVLREAEFFHMVMNDFYEASISKKISKNTPQLDAFGRL